PTMRRRRLLPGAVLAAFAIATSVRGEPPLAKVEHKSPVLCLAFSADGATLATGCQDGTVRLTQVPGGKEVRVIDTGKAPVAGLAFSPDGKWLAVRQVGKTMSTWEVATGKMGRTGGFTNYKADRLAFTPDGSAVVATAPGEFVHWKITGGASGSK